MTHEQRVTRVDRPTPTIHRVSLACGHSFLVGVGGHAPAPTVGERRECVVCRADATGDARSAFNPPRLYAPEMAQILATPCRPDRRGPHTAEELAAAWRDLQARTSTVPHLVLRSADHPEANGRTRMPGEPGWSLTFRLEDGRAVRLELGAHNKRKLEQLLLAEMLAGADDRRRG